MKRLYFIVLIILIFSSASLSQDNYSFKQISYEQGLPGSNVRNIFQDSRGIIWIAMEAMGLCKYDGHKFKLYTNIADDSTSISSNFLNRITEDTLGYIWIATDDKLNRYDYRTDQFMSFSFNPDDSTSVPDNVIYMVDTTNDGSLWCGTGNGFALINPVTLTFKRYLFEKDNQKSTNKNKIYKIYQGKNNVLWVGSTIGIYKFIKNKSDYEIQEKYSLKYSRLKSVIYDLKEDNYGNLWIGSSSILGKLNIRENIISNFPVINEKGYKEDLAGVSALVLDKNNNLWVGTSTKGIVIINTQNNQYKRITKNEQNRNTIQSDHIRALLIDKNETIWVGTKYGGIFKYTNKNKIFNNWPEKYNLLLPLSNKYILNFYEDKNGIYWIGTKYSGLYKIDENNNSIENITYDKNNPYSISSERVQCILRDSQNHLWICTDEGLDLYNEKTKKTTHLNSYNVYYISEDYLGNIWVGTRQGLYVVDFQNKKTIEYPNNKNDIFHKKEFEITYIFTDSKGYIWFSSKLNGVFLFNPKTMDYMHYSKHTSPKSKINSNMIRPVFEDDNGKLWVGTKETGITLYDRESKTFKAFDIHNGLASNMVLCIEQDFSGNLWLGTNNGLSKFDVNNETFVNFNQDYGIKSNVSELGANHRFKDGALLFGGSNGFNVFYPAEISKSDVVAPLIISSVKIFENEILRDITETQNLNLKHNENNISFEFCITNYNQPARHQFKCYMEGVDNEWNNLGNRNYASYTSLNPGNYIFHVNGANELGVWNNEMIIKITISKPWWQTWIFRIISFTFIISVIITIYYIRLSQIQKQKRLLEKKVAIRTKELNETNTLLEERQQQVEEQTEELKVSTEELSITNEHLKNSNATKDKLFSIIAHDLKNPFNSVIGFSELIVRRHENMSHDKLIHMVDSIYSSAKSIYGLLENLLQWSRSQTGKLKFNPEKINLNQLIDENIKLLTNMITAKELTIENNVPAELYTFSDKQILLTIIRNLLTNAIKYTEKGKITFSVDISVNDINVFIEDTGIGISPEKLKTLFEVEKSKSTQGTRGELGTGLGLLVCKEFVELNGGSIRADSKVGQGTTFTFTCPLLME